MDYGKITENMGLKVGALAVALLLWFHIATEKDTYDRILEVPIQVEGVPSDLIISAELPLTVQVRFHGRGKNLLTLPWRDVRVVVDASDILVRGTRSRHLNLSNVRYPESPDLTVVEILEPDQITIETDRFVSMRLPVMARMDIQVAGGHTFVGTVEVVPDSVTVSGPRSFLRDLIFVETDTLRSKRRARERIDQEVAIRNLSIYNLSMEPSQVRLVQDVQPLGERTFTEVAVRFDGRGNIDRYLAQPQNARVTVSGGVRLLEKLTEEDIRLILNLNLFRPDVQTPLTPRVELPEGVSLLILDPQQFRVTEY